MSAPAEGATPTPAVAGDQVIVCESVVRIHRHGSIEPHRGQRRPRPRRRLHRSAAGARGTFVDTTRNRIHHAEIGMMTTLQF